MKVSIIMAYYNRYRQLINTLYSIQRTKHDDYEVIIVDDGSNEDVSSIQNDFKFVRIIRIEPENKKHINSCIPFNIGIRNATGDIIVIQNPECYHVQDIITYIVKNINQQNYLSISTYALSSELTSKFNGLEIGSDFFVTLPQIGYEKGKGIGWYNHSVYRPVGYHFCSALTKENMSKLGGFDERFANGIGYDDNEFLTRVKRLGLEVKIVDEVSVIHLWHYKLNVVFNRTEYFSKLMRNKELYNKLTVSENSIMK